MSDLFKKTEQAVRRSREIWFNRVMRLFDRAGVEEGVWGELEELLLSADVGVKTTTRLTEGVKRRVKEERLTQGDQVRAALKGEMLDLLRADASYPAPRNRGFSGDTTGLQVILVVGVNGSGKTTTIAKLAHWYKGEGKRVILAAADTFRAAAIEQIKEWGKRAGAEVIAHQPGGDPGAVAFDALQAAVSRQAHAVIIDTAGRLHTNSNLMEELKKIKRVITKFDASAPHEVLLILDATTGQNGLAQASYFTEAVGTTGIFLSKLDGTAKGGIVLSIYDELKIPIHFIGTGEGLDDLAPFAPEDFVEALCS